MPQTAILAALPREVALLVRGVPAEAGLLKNGVHLHRTGNAVVVAAGMGERRAALAFAAAVQGGEVDEVLSVGLAGACLPELAPGSVVTVGTVVDVRTGERTETADAGGAVLATTASIASVQEKARLRAAYGAALVDMEAATVARLARARGLRFRAIKGISDAHDFELASLARFGRYDGHFRTGAFALHTALRPHHWPRAVKLGRHSNQALAELARVLQPLL